jgi:hypothetical protein
VQQFRDWLFSKRHAGFAASAVASNDAEIQAAVRSLRALESADLKIF